MSIFQQLLNWYDVHGRKLPWRRTRDPYRVLVSEIMLQQTQVERVKDYYGAWLERFPNFETLAAATNAHVLEAWAGLGYNRRALMLRDIARHVVEQGVPQTEEGWRAIKGIGPYTSAAVMAFAFKETTTPVDTNIRRVIGRLFLNKPFTDLKDDADVVDVMKTELEDIDRAYDVPQAIFDLATMYCTKKPTCEVCPMRDVCPMAGNFIAGSIETPKRTVKKANEKIHRNKKHPDRIFRGRILKLVRENGSVRFDEIGEQVDKSFDEDLDSEWLVAMVKRLEKDRMVEIVKDTVRFVR